MPRKKINTREETASERYFPVDEDDLKRTTKKRIKTSQLEIKTKTEKPYKGKIENPIEEIKKTRVRKTRKRAKTKGKKKTTKKVPKTYKPQKIKLKKEGYELIITEKPQAALKIAEALGKATKKVEKTVPYYLVKRNGKSIVVACAVGHLFSLHQNKKGSDFPTFDISWNPNFIVRKADFTKKYFDNILRLAKNAGEITIATDYDVEGEVIGLNITRFLCGQEDAKRMKFSTLTNNELNKSYDNKSSVLNWGQAIAGETRHYLDWYYGINLSRALMAALKSTGRFKIMSIGRVQGPALNLIVKKEREIEKFEPKPYWQVIITVKNSHLQDLKHNKDIFDKTELKQFEKLKGKEVVAKTTKKKENLPPGTPFNLTTLQTEAYKFHGITPSNTLRAAQSLYLSGLISYPRTSSQKLPDSIGYKEILKKVANKFKATELIKKSKPIEGKKSDPAHPSIYPTGNFQILAGDEEKIYNLVAKRFIALFCEDAEIEKKRIEVIVNKLKFSALGYIFFLHLLPVFGNFL
jgi:DNA topoisomerase-1